VARLSRIGRHDRYPRYELTKSRLADALRGGTTIDVILDELSRMTDASLPQNVVTTLRAWTDEFESMRLHDGVILEVAESRRHMVEHIDDVRRLVVREFMPGLYLVRRDNLVALQRALETAGVDMVPQLAGDAGESTNPQPVRIDSTGSRGARLGAVLSEIGGGAPPSLSTDESWKSELLSSLSKGKLSSDQREELAARIDKRLILNPKQIRQDTVRAEKNEARGLDYAGKVRLIEQALRDGYSYLEVIERSADGNPVRRLVAPLDVEKHGTGLILLGETVPDREEVRVPVGKLSLVRRLRGGLVKRRPIR
jgi:hypothetical protein